MTLLVYKHHRLVGRARINSLLLRIQVALDSDGGKDLATSVAAERFGARGIVHFGGC